MAAKENVTLREDVLLAINAKFPVIRRLFGVRKIGIFGSVARGEERPGSDIDLEVEFEPGLDTFQNYAGLSLYLDELLGRKVDLVTTRVLASYFRPELGAEHAALNRDQVYLAQMKEEMGFLLARVRGMTAKDLARDETLRRAVVRSLDVIGESAHRVSGPFRKQHPGIPWNDLEALKYRLIHPYFSLDWGLVWNAVTVFLPEVAKKLYV
jgi:hypothetical protein